MTESLLDRFDEWIGSRHKPLFISLAVFTPSCIGLVIYGSCRDSQRQARELRDSTLRSQRLEYVNADEDKDLVTVYESGRRKIEYGGFQDEAGNDIFLTGDEVAKRLEGRHRVGFEKEMERELAKYTPTTQPITTRPVRE